MRETMIHPNDAEVLCSLLRVSDIPATIVDEYEIRRRMYHAGGGSGALGIQQLIGVLRHVGVDLPARDVPVNVDWRDHVGDAIVAKYGDQDVSGTLVSLCDGGNLVLVLDGIDGEVELPRYCVKLEDKKPRKMSEKKK